MNPDLPLVSAIVTTKNEEKNIENCLKSIRNQTYLSNLRNRSPNLRNQSTKQSGVEIIVVDNNSTDKTKEIVKEFKKRFTPLNVQLFNGGPERSAQRNFGVEKAKGKYILYLDADMTLSKDVISECVEKCLPRRKPTCPVASASAGWYGEAFLRGEDGDYIALYIPERIVGNSFWVRVRDFERSFYNATCIDCVRFTRRDKFLEIGGFDESLTGPEDWDFDRRIKETGKVGIIDTPLYHNEGEFNLREYLRKKGYYSQTFDNYIKKWGRRNLTIRKQLGVWYRLFGVFIEDGKWKDLLRHPMLTLGMYILRFMVGVNYLLFSLRKIG